MLNLLKYKKSLILSTIVLTAILTKPPNENLAFDITGVEHDKLKAHAVLSLFTTYHDYIFFKTATIYVGEEFKCIGLFNRWICVNE